MTTTDVSPLVGDVAAAGTRLPRRRTRGPERWIIAAVLVVLLVAWEVVSRLDWINSDFISRPTLIAAAVGDVYGDEAARTAILTTAKSILLAILFGVLVGIVVGYLLGSVRLLRDAFFAPALFLMSVPKSIFIPIFLVAFGINSQTSVYYGAFSGFIYVMVNVISGLDLVEPRHLRVADAYAASWWQRLRDIVLPASVPGVFTGIWYGIQNGLQGVLIFELFISVGGLGALINNYTNRLLTDRVFVIVLTLSVVAIALGECWSAIERRLSRWRPSSTALADTRR